MGVTRQLIAFAVTVVMSAAAGSPAISGRWELKIEDKRHHVVATLLIQFTAEPGQSCMSGDWRRIKVLSATTKNHKFFPVSDPLSFQLEKNELTIGRMEICDAYLMLAGPLNGEQVSGDYSSVGLGGAKPLGSFTLRRK